MGNRNRPIVPSTVPAGPIARRGGGGIMPFSIFVVAVVTAISVYQKNL